ncbi:peptide deformylase [Thiothrix subterranea]|uniref:Peptide deformylase n=1 Tax=Thiothrix subterranea TaxID=2735563 RepID=A0AA51MMX7_9GAMM|nr:peptide deformylase [Thiothrix subterranea]MDQ5767872.1 peptide deformylase [Thiothrix subterranea]WML86669.1 peptide deformylase [Thiothrix subterranea]
MPEIPRILPIAAADEPILHQPAHAVADVSTPAIQRLLDDMLVTLQAANGVGIAAPQVFAPLRIIIVASRPNPRYPDAPLMSPIAMLNPEILWQSDTTCSGWEGCLSVPDTRAQVKRAERLRISYLTRTGERVEATYSGFVARIIQHECDHLDGILFPERLEDPSETVSEAVFQALQNAKTHP